MPRKRKAGKPTKSGRKSGRSTRAKTHITGGFARGHSSTAGQEDAEYTTHRYEYSTTQNSASGAAVYIQLKGNSIYRPYVGNTDSVGGYARMYTQYERSVVMSSSVEVTLGYGSGTPTRVALVPCNSTQYSVYSAFTNVAQLRDVPHSREVIFSPGSKVARLTSRGATTEILFGETREDKSLESGVASFFGTSGVDPTTLWYYVLGFQPLDATTTAMSVNVRLSFKVKWFRPIATAVQVALNRWGNEEIAPGERSEDREVKSELKGPLRISAKGQAYAPAETKSQRKEQQTGDESKLSVSTSRRCGGDALLFGEEADPESDDPEEVWLRKVLAARLGTVPTRAAFAAALKASVVDPSKS